MSSKEPLPPINVGKLTLLNLTGITPQEPTAQYLVRMMRENPHSEIVFAIQSYDGQAGPMDDTVRSAAGSIFLWLNPVTRGDTVPKSVFEQLLNDGLIEKEREDSLSITYKLSKRT